MSIEVVSANNELRDPDPSHDNASSKLASRHDPNNSVHQRVQFKENQTLAKIHDSSKTEREAHNLVNDRNDPTTGQNQVTYQSNSLKRQSPLLQKSASYMDCPEIQCKREREERVRQVKCELELQRAKKLQGLLEKKSEAYERRAAKLNEMHQRLTEKHRVVEEKRRNAKLRREERNHAETTWRNQLLNRITNKSPAPASGKPSSSSHQQSQRMSRASEFNMTMSWAPGRGGGPDSGHYPSHSLKPFGALPTPAANYQIGTDGRPRASTGRLIGFGSSAPRTICEREQMPSYLGSGLMSGWTLPRAQSAMGRSVMVNMNSTLTAPPPARRAKSARPAQDRGTDRMTQSMIMPRNVGGASKPSPSNNFSPFTRPVSTRTKQQPETASKTTRFSNQIDSTASVSANKSPNSSSALTSKRPPPCNSSGTSGVTRKAPGLGGVGGGGKSINQSNSSPILQTGNQQQAPDLVICTGESMTAHQKSMAKCPSPPLMQANDESEINAQNQHSKSEEDIYRAKLAEQRRLIREKREQEKRDADEAEKQRQEESERVKAIEREKIRQEEEQKRLEQLEEEKEKERILAENKLKIEQEKLAKQQKEITEREERRRKLDLIMSRVKDSTSPSTSAVPAVVSQQSNDAALHTQQSDVKLESGADVVKSQMTEEFAPRLSPSPSTVKSTTSASIESNSNSCENQPMEGFSSTNRHSMVSGDGGDTLPPDNSPQLIVDQIEEGPPEARSPSADISANPVPSKQCKEEKITYLYDKVEDNDETSPHTRFIREEKSDNEISAAFSSIIDSPKDDFDSFSKESTQTDIYKTNIEIHTVSLSPADSIEEESSHDENSTLKHSYESPALESNATPDITLGNGPTIDCQDVATSSDVGRDINVNSGSISEDSIRASNENLSVVEEVEEESDSEPEDDLAVVCEE